MADLILPVKRIYFEQIKGGSKVEEFRLVTDFWRKRLYARSYDRVVITLGYPKRDDASRRMVFGYRGFRTTTITHPHFGDQPVKVFAIDLSGPKE